VGEIGVFLHDSEHSYENMLFEYQSAWAHLKSGGILLSHNIDTNNAFSEFCHNMALKGHILDNLGGLSKP
jgi:hypothetical protein